MKFLLTTSNLKIILDDEDYERCKNYTWTASSSQLTTRINRQQKITMGQFLLKTSLEVDHKDRDFLNNQRSNLREATPSENMANREKWSKGDTSKYKGVYFHKLSGKWMARIAINNKRVYLGIFDSEITAAKRYNTAAKKYHKEFAVLNVIESMEKNDDVVA